MSKDTALLIVDVQVAMFSYEDQALYNGEKVLDNIVLLLEKARKSDVPVIFIQHTSEEDDEYNRAKPTWHIHPRIAPLTSETVVEKTTWDSFYKTRLEQVLEEKGIKKLIIMGMQTEFCLDTTCRAAYSKGYHDNVLVRDANSTFDGPVLTADKIVEHHNTLLGGRFVKSMYTDEIEFL
ncbi:cysteine hydrolase family protein [Clostridium sp. C8-1-8]|uniref:cysteine hydrolase family protein n=1 Tax=Clostridium sp. C8-1-8 TaxID=2698831 RepID=UPI00136E0E73|nr:cysteine hydrolase family protein [Clostridium sp. C8-1-8]